MARTISKLATVGKAYMAGRCATLRPPSPLQQHRTAEALAQASPEVVAAFELGRSADPREPMPEAGEVLAEVVQRLSGELLPRYLPVRPEVAADLARSLWWPGIEELLDPGPPEAPAGTTSGPECAAPGELGQSGPALQEAHSMKKNTSPDEKTLGDLAHLAYIHGRLATWLPEPDPLRVRMAASYLPEAGRQPVESYCYLYGLLTAGEAVLDRSALLDAVHDHVFGPAPRRRPRPDTRWGAKS